MCSLGHDTTTGDEDQERSSSGPTAKMATNHGVIVPFDSSQEDWLSYITCLQNYFVANDIAEDKEAKRQAILLSVCSESTYHLIKSLAAPSKPEEFPLRIWSS